MFTIYRPFLDIEESVAALSREDLHLIGRLNCSILIKTILANLDLIVYDKSLVETNETAKFYWNGGEPFLNDLMYYYNVAEELWLDQGGYSYNYILDYEDILGECDFIENEAPWSKGNAYLHKLVLLKRDRQWYKRKFLDIKHYEIIDSSLFKGGKPSTFSKSLLNKQCRFIENV